MQLHELEKLLNTLKEIGLSVNEANTYVALLNIGANPVSTIAKTAGLNRCNCYTILEKLMQKGFIREVIRQSMTYYEAVEPKYILTQLKSKRSNLEDQIENLSIILDNFSPIQNNPNVQNGHLSSPRVVFFEGEAGVKNIMEDTLTAKNDFRAYASLNDLVNLLPDYFPSYYKRRAAKGIFAKVIYPTDQFTIDHQKRDQEELRESRLIPKEFDFKLDIVIYDNKIAITSLKEKFGVIIESQELADAKKRIFDLIWDKTGCLSQLQIITQKIEIPSKKPSTETGEG